MVHRPAKLVDEMDHRLVQPQGQGDKETEQGGGAQERKHAEPEAHGDGERDFVGGDALGELRDSRIKGACARRSVCSPEASRLRGSVRSGSVLKVECNGTAGINLAAMLSHYGAEKKQAAERGCK